MSFSVVVVPKWPIQHLAQRSRSMSSYTNWSSPLTNILVMQSSMSFLHEFSSRAKTREYYGGEPFSLYIEEQPMSSNWSGLSFSEPICRKPWDSQKPYVQAKRSVSWNVGDNTTSKISARTVLVKKIELNLPRLKAKDSCFITPSSEGSSTGF